MRRQYLFHRFETIVERLFARMPNLNLGTDLLVGFPAEDRDAFLNTYRYVERAPFAYAHVFPFSARPDTPAADYRPEAPASEITERAARLRELARMKNIEYRSRFIGQPLSALLLRGTGEALTDNYIRVKLLGQVPRTDIVSIRINKVDPEATFGTAIQ